MGRRRSVLTRVPRTRAEATTQAVAWLVVLVGVPTWLVIKTCQATSDTVRAPDRGLPTELRVADAGVALDASVMPLAAPSHARGHARHRTTDAGAWWR